MAAASKRRVCTTEGCGQPAFGKRIGGEWRRFETCRKCMAASNLMGMVQAWKDHEMRYHEKELQLLRQVEKHVRERYAGPVLQKLLDDLRTLRSLQSASQSSSPT